MKKVLLTNAYISGYTGSELDTVEIANYFIKKGYNVDIFTLEVGNLCKEINSKIRVVTMNNIQDLYLEYDILWAHHYPLVDYLLFSSNIKFHYIHYICLSSIENLEQIPVYYEDLNMISVMSYNTRTKLLKENPIYKEDRIEIFPNYALKKYFSYLILSRKVLKKVAIVSNHVPDELISVKKRLENDGIEVEIYGINYNYLKVDDEVLKNYDLIISIGKTCFYSLAMGIPTYIYDRMGGNGYVRKSNIENFFKGNFVCLSTAVKMSDIELYNDIVNGYFFNKNELNYMQKFGMKHFCFENNMNLFLDKLLKTAPFSNNILKDEYLFLKKTSSLYVKNITDYLNIIDELKYELIDKKNKCQLFYLVTDNFLEEKSLKKVSKNTGNEYEVTFLLKDDCDKIRFDFCEEEYIVFSELKLNGKKISFDYHDLMYIDGEYISINNDPYVIINKAFKKNDVLKFTYCLEKYSMKKTLDLLNEKNLLDQKLNLIMNGRFFKLYTKLKKFILG